MNILFVSAWFVPVEVAKLCTSVFLNSGSSAKRRRLYCQQSTWQYNRQHHVGHCSSLSSARRGRRTGLTTNPESKYKPWVRWV